MANGSWLKAHGLGGLAWPWVQGSERPAWVHLGALLEAQGPGWSHLPTSHERLIIYLVNY